MNQLCAALVCCVLSVFFSEANAQSSPAENDLILVCSTDKSPDAAVEAIKSYAENRKWVYMGNIRSNPLKVRSYLSRSAFPKLAG